MINKFVKFYLKKPLSMCFTLRSAKFKLYIFKIIYVFCFLYKIEGGEC